jgi:quinolinate synthase
MAETSTGADRATETELMDRIRTRKAEFGERLVILGHHYQRKEIVRLSDIVGDSFQLSKQASESAEAEYIVFCGVRFMAECAAILGREGQKVLHPDPEAGCPMADMADIYQVESAWEELSNILDTGSVVPVTYVNSDAELKAFCGRNGGTVCTSSNADAAFDWGFERGERLFFFPDQYLGRNTAFSKGIPKDEIVLWDPANFPNGGLEEEDIERAKVILWNGYCHVHTWFQPSMIEEAREKYPGCTVVVHPECHEDVVAMADAAGSTGFIVKYVREAEPGSTIVVGTEANLVNRLDEDYPDRKVVPLSRSICPNMWKISLRDLAWTLEHLDKADHVVVQEPVKSQAKVALDRMLTIK